MKWRRSSQQRSYTTGKNLKEMQESFPSPRLNQPFTGMISVSEYMMVNVKSSGWNRNKIVPNIIWFGQCAGTWYSTAYSSESNGEMSLSHWARGRVSVGDGPIMLRQLFVFIFVGVSVDKYFKWDLKWDNIRRTISISICVSNMYYCVMEKTRYQSK